MNTVWVVEDGVYSDYRVVGVFSTKQHAELIQEKVGGSIAEWPLDPKVSELSQGYTVWRVEMLRDGTVERVEQSEMTQYAVFSSEPEIWRRSTAPFYRGKGVQDCLSGSVLARDAEHAIKIFNERRAQLIATNRWK
jgi:hypothetical protein